GEGIDNVFGYSVSSTGDVNGDGYSDVIVGAYLHSNQTGRAYIFYGGASMNNAADVVMTGEGINNRFGHSVYSAGDVNGDGYSDVIVGAYTYNSGTGRAYIFYGGASMNNTADVTMTGEATFNYFGTSVSAAGDVNGDGYSDVIAGATGYNGSIGRAYLYKYEFEHLPMTGEATNNYFGYSVSGAGDVNGDGYSDVIIGAYKYNNDIGRAYIFYGGTSMNNIADVTMTGETTNSNFGVSVSGAGDVNGDGYSDVIVGAWQYNGTGRAYIFYGGSSMNNTADVTMTGETTHRYFGNSVSAAGDVNGDGYSDVIIGAWFYDDYRGRAYIFYGGASMNNAADVVMTGETISGQFGVSVSEAGDVNGDGYSDVIVGAYLNNAGRAFIFYGGAGMNNTADVIMSGEATDDRFGVSVSAAGDVNGDGYSDVIVGASAYGVYSTGRVYIFHGGASMNNAADVTMTGEATDGRFGISVSAAGDVNFDGYSDVIVGANGYNGSTGKAYIFYGGVNMNNTADVTMTGEATINNFGFSVSAAGDVNGDGNPDLIIGAFGNNNNTGKSYLYFTSSPTVVSIINIKVIPEGFYDASTNRLNKKDTVRAYLRNVASPFAVTDSAAAVIDSVTYQGAFKFFNAPNGTYYIVIKHRNTIETWSRSGGEPFVIGTTMSYGFTNIITKAFGNNMKQVDALPVVFAIYSGDVNQDGVVDGTDAALIDNDASNFDTGYLVTDLNGDEVIDGSDAAIADNNAANFVSIARP
ncbi:MAG: FG-GAP-like repeat-containing protein, partial [Ignavibacteria bacterium]